MGPLAWTTSPQIQTLETDIYEGKEVNAFGISISAETDEW